MEKKGTQLERVNFSLTHDVAKTLKILAIENDTTASGLVTRWIKEAAKDSTMISKLNA